MKWLMVVVYSWSLGSNAGVMTIFVQKFDTIQGCFDGIKAVTKTTNGLSQGHIDTATCTRVNP